MSNFAMNQSFASGSGQQSFLSRLLRIRGRLVILLVLFGLIPAGVVFGVYLQSEATIERTVAAQFHNLAVSSGDIIDRNLFERYGDVQAFTLNGEAHDPANYKKPGASNPLVRVMNGYMTNYGLYKLMVLADAAGNVLAVNSTDAKGATIPTDALFPPMHYMPVTFPTQPGSKMPLPESSSTEATA